MPDGIGLRNFAYSGFYGKGLAHGFDLAYWNNTSFPLSALGFPEISMDNARMSRKTYIYKTARKHIELDMNIKKTGDKIYDTYRYAFFYSDIRSAIKNIAAQWLIAFNSSEKGLRKIKHRIDSAERQTPHYQKSLETLKREKPDMVFLTNQRSALAIASILAAKDLGIPTATFIFSWDNLPKATMVVDTDYYIVWSELMKEQLLFYYPDVKPEEVFVTGTPQFETHYDPKIIMSKNDFFEKYGLDKNRKYICFSGDDVTSSPDDPAYLEDTAIAVRELNAKGHDLGIVFRRCPPDISGRYKTVVEKYKDIITEIEPDWKPIGQAWFDILPTPEDVTLLANTIAHTEMVVNLGSSMVFDYAAFGKSCGYFNYNQPVQIDPKWSIHECYKYVHFRSMPSTNAVLWLNAKASLADDIESVISGKADTSAEAQRWFAIINQHTPTLASERILDAFDKIIARSGKAD